MGRRRVESFDDDLEALDPTTGRAIVAHRPGPPPVGTGAAGWARARRVRRLRRLRAVCVLLAVGSAAAAGYAGMAVVATRQVERTWRTAMAVDDARAEADRQILDTLRSFGDDDSETADAFLIAVGVAERAELAEAEQTLRAQRIVDRRTSDLRDQMIDALRFRQLQMSPARRRLGDSPLVLVEDELARQLRRWRLGPSRVPPPRLPAAEQALERLGNFTDRSTGTILVALQGHTLLTVDLEADTISRRSIPVQVDRVLAVGPTTVVVVGGNGTVAYGLDGERDPAPRWERPGAFAFATPNDEGLWLVEGPTVLRLDPEGRAVAGPFTLPPATAVAGAMEGGLVLEPAGPPATRTIQLWEPATGARTTLATNIGRFVGASRGFALVEGPLSLAEAARSSGAGRFGDVLRIVDRSGATVRVLGLPASVGVAAQRPDERELAVAVGPLAGRLASVFRIGLQDEDALLAPVTGPRAKIGRGSLVWSRSGASLFWVTPDGRLAVHDRAARRSAIVRAPVQGVDQIVAFDAPQ